jgi:putative selenate reductase
MAELVPTPFPVLLRRQMLEFERHRAIFDLPENKWWKPSPEDIRRTRCRFHGHWAGGPFGPAAGPQDQMAQNVVLSFLVGGRVMELKTVQILDTLKIGRPCIEAATVGYNIEWSQELRLRQSLEEYVKAAMLVHILQRRGVCGGQPEDDPVIYDLSVGYDLKGIQSPTVREFMRGMLDASEVVERLRAQIPDEFKALRDLDYPAKLSNSITLSTFHGCPPDEIERICEHLIGEYGLNTVVKMNPTMLGRERVEYLVREKLGYAEIEPRAAAFETGLQFPDSIEMCRRLHSLARQKGVGFGAKFTNTLETVNTAKDRRLPDDVKYTSGRPLHVISTELMLKFREAYGEPMEVTFSAGLEKGNAAEVVALGCVPATTCTDLLKTGGFARMTPYTTDWLKKQSEKGATDWASWIFASFGKGAEGCQTALEKLGHEADPESRRRLQDALGSDAPATHFAQLWHQTKEVVNPSEPFEKLMVRAMFEIQLANARDYVATLADNPIYHKSRNAKNPPKIDSHLVTFDCISCDKCVPVCPNDANYYYMVAPEAKFVVDVLTFDGSADAAGNLRFQAQPGRTFAVEKEHQIANFADWCNECGNCDTFCPEYDGPYIKKPSFYGSREAWEALPHHEGFFARRADSRDASEIIGRMEGAHCALEDRGPSASGARYVYTEGPVRLELTADYRVASARPATPDAALSPNRPATADLWRFHCLRKLLEGALDQRRVTSVNAAFWRAEAQPVG